VFWKNFQKKILEKLWFLKVCKTFVFVKKSFSRKLKFFFKTRFKTIFENFRQNASRPTSQVLTEALLALTVLFVSFLDTKASKPKGKILKQKTFCERIAE
jgi:hypothetical protein